MLGVCHIRSNSLNLLRYLRSTGPGPIQTVRLLYNFISVARGRASPNGPFARVISGNRYVSNCRLTSQQRRDIFVQPVYLGASVPVPLHQRILSDKRGKPESASSS